MKYRPRAFLFWKYFFWLQICLSKTLFLFVIWIHKRCRILFKWSLFRVFFLSHLYFCLNLCVCLTDAARKQKHFPKDADWYLLFLIWISTRQYRTVLLNSSHHLAWKLLSGFPDKASKRTLFQLNRFPQIWFRVAFRTKSTQLWYIAGWARRHT